MLNFHVTWIIVPKNTVHCTYAFDAEQVQYLRNKTVDLFGNVGNTWQNFVSTLPAHRIWHQLLWCPVISGYFAPANATNSNQCSTKHPTGDMITTNVQNYPSVSVWILQVVLWVSELLWARWSFLSARDVLVLLWSYWQLLSIFIWVNDYTWTKVLSFQKPNYYWTKQQWAQGYQAASLLVDITLYFWGNLWSTPCTLKSHEHTKNVEIYGINSSSVNFRGPLLGKWRVKYIFANKIPGAVVFYKWRALKITVFVTSNSKHINSGGGDGDNSRGGCANSKGYLVQMNMRVIDHMICPYLQIAYSNRALSPVTTQLTTLTFK